MKPIASGDFAEVFELGDGKVLKAFFDLATAARPDGDRTFIPRILFAAEVDAYVRLQQHPDLEVYVPRYFGTVDPRSFDLSTDRRYSSASGMVLERIDADEFKLHQLDEGILPEVESVIDRIKETVGVDHPWDASCFIPGTRAPFTIIDFAAPAARLAALDKLMDRYGTVPDENRRLLGLDFD